MVAESKKICRGCVVSTSSCTVILATVILREIR
jgi:hypothetical protein